MFIRIVYLVGALMGLAPTVYAQTLLSSIVQAPLTFSSGHIILPLGTTSSSTVVGNDTRLVPLGTAPPTTGANVVGNQVRNSAPTELGSAGAKYVIDGWVCLTAGTPGTWVPLIAFDGN